MHAAPVCAASGCMPVSTAARGPSARSPRSTRRLRLRARPLLVRLAEQVVCLRRVRHDDVRRRAQPRHAVRHLARIRLIEPPAVTHHGIDKHLHRRVHRAEHPENLPHDFDLRGAAEKPLSKPRQSTRPRAASGAPTAACRRSNPPVAVHRVAKPARIARTRLKTFSMKAPWRSQRAAPHFTAPPAPKAPRQHQMVFEIIVPRAKSIRGKKEFSAKKECHVKRDRRTRWPRGPFQIRPAQRENRRKPAHRPQPPDTRDTSDTTYVSRQELTNMVRRSRLKHLRISPHRRNSWMRHRLRSSVSGI